MGGITNPGIGAKIILWLLAIPVILFDSLLLAGCVSDSAGIPNLHLIELHTETELKIRVGYYGICLLGPEKLSCISTACMSETAIVGRIRQTRGKKTLAVKSIEEAIGFQKKAFLNVLAIGLAFFLLSLLFELLRIYSTKRVRKSAISAKSKRHRNFHRHIVMAFAWPSWALMFAAALANTQTEHALMISSNGWIVPGSINCGLHWASSAVSLVLCAGLTMMRRTKSGRGSAAPEAGFGDTQPLAADAAPMASIVTV